MEIGCLGIDAIDICTVVVGEGFLRLLVDELPGRAICRAFEFPRDGSLGSSFSSNAISRKHVVAGRMIDGGKRSLEDGCSHMVDECLEALACSTSVGSQIEFFDVASEQLPFGNGELALCLVQFEEQAIMRECL